MLISMGLCDWIFWSQTYDESLFAHHAQGKVSVVAGEEVVFALEEVAQVLVRSLVFC